MGQHIHHGSCGLPHGQGPPGADERDHQRSWTVPGSSISPFRPGELATQQFLGASWACSVFPIITNYRYRYLREGCGTARLAAERLLSTLPRSGSHIHCRGAASTAGLTPSHHGGMCMAEIHNFVRKTAFQTANRPHRKPPLRGGRARQAWPLRGSYSRSWTH